MKYAPIYVNSEYSFHRSAIKIDKYIDMAIQNGAESIVLTDFNVMYGVAEFILKAKKNNIKPVVGLELEVEDFVVILLAKNYAGYVKLNKLSSAKLKGLEINASDIDNDDIVIIDHPSLGNNAKRNKRLEFNNYYIGTNEPDADGVFVPLANTLNEAQEKSIHNLSLISQKNIEARMLDFNANVEMRAVKKAISIVEECNLDLPAFDDVFPVYKTEDGTKPIDFLKELIKQKTIEKLSDKKNRGTYQRRIQYEMRIIENLHFENYFLVLWDIVKWAKENKIVVGPGRGSAVGSLIVFLLGITDLDPIEYELLFERFLNPERVKLPDIDIDIQDNRREEVIKYIFNKYGENHAAFISTFSRYTAKAALREIARVKGLPEREINELTKKVDSKLHLIDSYNNNASFKAVVNAKDIHREIFNNALSIETLPKTYSTHAAGLVISNEHINTKMATHFSNDNHNQVQGTMEHLNAFGLIKFDILSLNNLTLIDNIAQLIRKNLQKSIQFSKIPLDDKLTFEVLQKGKTKGIFQLESYGMRKTIMDIKISSFKDFYAAIALYRPGPMKFIPQYIDRKLKKEAIEKISPVFDAVTKDTYGIVVFQEQIMKIAQEFSGMTYGRADILRRAITGDNLSVVNKMKQEFVEGALKLKRDKNDIEKIFAILFESSQYGFNKSHAIAYAHIGYQLAFLKARFPKEFYATLITKHLSSKDDVKDYIQEALDAKLQVISPLVSHSQLKALVVQEKILLPLQMIKGITERDAQSIIDEKNKRGKFENFFNFVARMIAYRSMDAEKIKVLVESNALINFGNMATLVESLPSALRYAKMCMKKVDGEVVLDLNALSRPLLNKRERNLLNEIKNERNNLGLQFNAFLTQGLEKDVKLKDIKENKMEEIVFTLESTTTMRTKKGDEYIIADISDSSRSVRLFIFDSAMKGMDNPVEGSILLGLVKRRVYDSRETYTLVRPWKVIKNG